MLLHTSWNCFLQLFGHDLKATTMSLQILEYHVVPGMSLSISNLTNGQMLQTMLPGQSIKVLYTARLPPCCCARHHEQLQKSMCALCLGNGL